MNVDICTTPDPEIFRDRKKYALWFALFMAMACTGVGIGVFAIYFDTSNFSNLDDWALGALVGASIGITWSGNRLQAYKRLYPPQLAKLAELRANHPVIDEYCRAVEAAGRGLIRAEYEACKEYAEDHSAVPFV